MGYFGLAMTPQGLIPEHQGKKNQGVSQVQHDSLANSDVNKPTFS